MALTKVNSILVDGAINTDASGNVGIGTSSPNGKFNLVNQGGTSIRFSVYGSANGSQIVGESAQGTIASPTATIADNNLIRILGTGYTGTDFSGSRAEISFAAAQNWTTTANGTYIKFNTTENDTTTSVERMLIDDEGNVLIGRNTPSSLDNVAGAYISGEGTMAIQRNGTCATFNRFTSDGAILAFRRQGTSVGTVSVTAAATAYNTTSDYRLKENVAPMTGALAVVGQLKPCTYTWKVNGSNGQGFIAHELQAVVPDCVTGEKDAVDSDGNPEYQGIDTSFLVATLTAAIQEQQAIITDLKARIETLEAK
jgi:hypothetical protein